MADLTHDEINAWERFILAIPSDCRPVGGLALCDMAHKHLKHAAAPEEPTPEWKTVGENGPHLGVAWIDWDATYVGKIGVKGQRHILKLPFIERPPRKG